MFSLTLARNTRLRSVVFFCATLLSAGPALSEQSELTLDAVVTLALAQAPELAAQRSAIATTGALTVSAGRLPDPELLLAIDDVPVTGPDAYSLSRDSFTTRKLGLMQTFPSAAKRRAEKSLAQSNLGVAQAGLARGRVQVAQAVAQAWFDRQVAEATLTQLQELTSQFALQEALSRAAMVSGRGSAADALSARAARAAFDDRLFAASAAVRRAVVALSRWLGERGDATLATAPNITDLPVAAASVLDHTDEHANIALYDSQIAAAQSEVQLARAAKRPDWSAELAYGHRAADFSDIVSLEFRVGLPLFTRYRQDPQIRAKNAALRQLESEREVELRMHRAELQVALADWRSSRDRLTLLESERLPLAQSRIDFALSAYRSGSGTMRSVLDALSDSVELKLTYVALQAQLGRDWALLAYQTSVERGP